MTPLTLGLSIMALIVFIIGIALIFLCWQGQRLELYDPAEGYPYDVEEVERRLK